MTGGFCLEMTVLRNGDTDSAIAATAVVAEAIEL